MREVVVTGGGTGIGFAVAQAFAEAGERVTITGRREEVLAEATAKLAGTGATGVSYVAFDAADPAAVEAALPDLPARVDVLVNNAGGLRGAGTGSGPVAVAAAWRATLDANLLAAVLVTTALTSRFAGGARIASIGSIAARRTAGAYGAAKAALEAWSATVAAELGPRGITANVVAPGLITDTEFFGGAMTEQRRDRLVAETFTGRAGRPADVAAAVQFLCSPQAGQVTGQVIHVNGGAHLGR